MLKVLKVTAAVLLLQSMMHVTVLAQDFTSLVSSAASATQQFVDQTNLALEATDLATLQARTRTAVATGQQVESLLQTALSVAPDDPSRSRVEGVLTHIRAAVASGQDALQATEFGAARGAVDAMRGEAEEALTELAPFGREVVAPATPVPAQLPQAGDTVSSPWGGAFAAAAMALGGAAAILAGLGIRGKAALR